MSAVPDLAAAPRADAPTPRTGRGRRVATWILLGVALLVVGAIGAGIAAGGEWSRRDQLDPESAGPSGTRALAEILRDHGVEVRVVRDRIAAADALDQQPATLVVGDTPALSDAGLRGVTDRAADVVLIDPGARSVDLLLPGSGTAGFAPEGVVDPGCSLAEAERSGPIEPGTLLSPGDDVIACYPADDGYGLLMGDPAGGYRAGGDGSGLLNKHHHPPKPQPPPRATTTCPALRGTRARPTSWAPGRGEGWGSSTEACSSRTSTSPRTATPRSR